MTSHFHRRFSYFSHAIHILTCSRPYEPPIVTVTVGRKRFGLPAYFLRKYPQFDHQLLWRTSIDLSDVHEDVGHTLVHFLYSGSYETIDSPLEEGESEIFREYRKAVLAYQASRTYKLLALETLAKRYIELFGEGLTMPDILQITRKIFPKLPEDETWLPNHIKLRLKQLLVSGGSESDLDALHKVFGEENSFESVMTRMMLEILSHRLRHRDNIEDSSNQHSQINNCVDEAEDISTKEPWVAVQSKESQSDYLLVESYPEPEEAPAEAYPEEAAAAENYPEPEEAAAEAYPEEAAAAESYPEPEEAAAEAYPEEAAAAESYPEAEDAPADAYPEEAADVYFAREESLPSPENHTSKLLTKCLLENVYLYEDWENLSPKKRRLRTKKLRARSLPIPDKDGVISTLVV